RRGRGTGGDSAGECRPAGTAGAGELRHPPAREAAGEGAVERGQSRRQPSTNESGRSETNGAGTPQSVQQRGGVRQGTCFVFSSPSCQWPILPNPHDDRAEPAATESGGGGRPVGLADGAPDRGRVHRYERWRRDGDGGTNHSAAEWHRAMGKTFLQAAS